MPLIEDGTLSTGVSINAIFNVIFADSFKSEQIIIQSIGRALRLHSDKKKAMIFDLVDVFNPKIPTNTSSQLRIFLIGNDKFINPN